MVVGNINEVNLRITNVIIQAANFSIPKSSPFCKKRNRPWWNEECKLAKKKQQKAWRQFRRYPTTFNYIAFKRTRAEAKKIYRSCQRKSWICYVSNFSSCVSSKIMWKRVKRGMGINSEPRISTILENGHTLSNIQDITNAIGRSFASISSSENYSHSFIS